MQASVRLWCYFPLLSPSYPWSSRCLRLARSQQPTAGKRPTVGQRRGCSSPAANPPTANSNSQQPAASSAQPTSRRQHSFPRARLLHACAALLSPPFARLATAPLATAAWSWSDFPPTPTTPRLVPVGASPRAARGVDDHAVEKPPGTVAVTQPKTPQGKKGGHCPTRHPRWRSTETPGRRLPVHIQSQVRLFQSSSR